MTDSLKRTEYYYNTDNVLQNVAVWEFPEDNKAAEPSAGATKKYWLIFVHGGAWRDPRATFNEAEPTISALLDPSSQWHLPDAPSRIAGFASINYRLSPHPSFAQDVATTPSFAARTARHPDHLDDVLAGLRFLQARFGFGGEYVFFGHSAGAFLNYQVLLLLLLLRVGKKSGTAGTGRRAGLGVALPAAVVGFEGIYDLVGLDARMGGAYSSFIEGAFGTDRRVWVEASPATAPGSFTRGSWSADSDGGDDDYNDDDGAVRLAVLAHSPDDELVDMAEVDAMEARLLGDGVANVLVFRDLRGGHAEVLNDGSFARVLVRTLGELERLDGE